MREKLLHSLYASLEWRVIAFIITNLFFWFTTNSFWKAAGLALILQAVLFLAQILWHFVRYEHGFEDVPPHLFGHRGSLRSDEIGKEK